MQAQVCGSRLWAACCRLLVLDRRGSVAGGTYEANGTLFNCEWIGRHGLAWPGAHACTRSHQHAGTSAHARTRRTKVLASVPVGGPSGLIRPDARSIRTARWPRMRCILALAPNQSAGVVDELDEPLPRLPRDACSTPTRPAKGSHRQWPVASQ